MVPEEMREPVGEVVAGLEDGALSHLRMRWGMLVGVGDGGR